MLRIATINNLSARAYGLALPEYPAQVVQCSPSGCHEQLKAGLCDAALLPVASLPECAPLARPLGPYGIACEGRVFSVLLFARRSLRQTLAMRSPVYVTPQSRTSRMLLPVLCRIEYGETPVLTDTRANAGASLLIGDAAMDTARGEYQWPVIKDLGQWWHDCTGQPFVFARWVARRDITPDERGVLLRWLETCAARSETETGVRRLAETGLRDGLFNGSAESAMTYYQRLRVRLTLRDISGLNQFLNMMREERACAKTA